MRLVIQSLVLIVFTVTPPLIAQCSLSVSPSYDAPSNTLVVTVTLGSHSCGNNPGVALNVQGSDFIYSASCPSLAGCSLPFTYDTSCWAPGTHNITATSDCFALSGSSCNRLPAVQQSASFSIADATPQASVTVEQLTPTSVRVHMPYTFTDTSSPGQRGLKLEHFLPDGSGDSVYWVDQAPTPQGEWTHDFDMTCWTPGGHQFVFTATACNAYSKRTQTAYTVSEDVPNVSMAVVNTTPTAIRVDTSWSFPAAAGSFDLHHYAPDGSEPEGVHWTFGGTQTGTYSQAFNDTTCWLNGTHTFKLYEYVCNRLVGQTQATLEINHRPTLALSVRPPTDNEGRKAVLSYQFPSPDNPNGRSLTLEFLPELPATTTRVVWSGTPDANTQNPLILDVPDFGTSGILRARASNSCGEVVVQDAQLDCSCHVNEGRRDVGGPVRLWDGSMTYTERDPLPSDGFPLFVRSYDTLNTADGLFGIGWHSVFDAGLVHFTDGSTDTVTIRTEGERRASFINVNGVWMQNWPVGAGASATLTTDANGWRYREAGSSIVRLYRADGHFGGFQDLGVSKTVSIDYDASGHPTRVYDADGTWSCSIVTSGNHITTISVDGRSDLVWQYTYSGSQLLSVSLGGATPAWRNYTYSAGLLASVTDATRAVLEAHAYDAQGRATTSTGGPQTDITSITYGLPGNLADDTITQVTYATGEVTTYQQRFINGRQQTIANNGGCGSCGSRNMTYAIDDATGQVVRNQDARGYISVFGYDTAGRLTNQSDYYRPAFCDPETDSTHCRLSAPALLTASLQPTSASTVTTYAYADPLWPDKPTTIARPSVMVPGNTHIDTITYDAVTGTPLTRTSSGWTVDATGQLVHIDQTTTVTLYDGTASAAFDPGRTFSASWLTLPQPSGKRKSIDGPRTDASDVTSFVYYPVDATVPANNRGRLAAVRNAAGHITSYENYDVFGQPARIVDANSVATEFTFDALGRVLTSTRRAGCPNAADPMCGTDDVTTNTYASITGPLAAVTDPKGNVATYEYDGRERLTAKSRGSSLASRSERMEYTYDAASLKIADRFFFWGNPDPSLPSIFGWQENRRESYSYDMLAQLTAQTHSDGTSTGYGYDDAGSVTSIRDENHGTANTRYSYDPARRLLATRQTLGAGEIVTSYAYDIAGNLTSVTDPNGNTTTYAYDDFGRMLLQTSPVTGTTTYVYDVAGNLISSTDANGATTTRYYDALNRIVGVVSAAAGKSTENVSFGYDSGGPYALGRLTLMNDPSGSTTYIYERRGLLALEYRTSGSASMTTSYVYDSNGNRTSITYPSGMTLSYSYDFANRPLSLMNGASTIVAGATYLPFGPEVSVSFGNGTMQTRSYDARYRIQRNTLTGSSGTPIADYTYAEDAVGNITSIHDATDATYNRDFGYDDFNRLVTANTGASLWGTGGYRYDAMGNLLGRDLGGVVEVDPNDPLIVRGRTFAARSDSLPAPGSIHETYAYSGTTSKLVTVTSGGIDHPLTYDAAGNELRYFDDRTYSARNLMASISEPSEDGKAHTINYGYDGRGVRVIRSEGTTGYATPFANRYYVYSPELQLLAMTADDNANVWSKTAISNSLPPMKHEIAWFGGRPVAELASGTSVRYTFCDHLGTPLLQTDTNQSVVWRAEYEPFGDVYALRNGTSAADQPLRFPGQEYERKWEGAEERYNIFRWYRAGWGRYTQTDPLQLAGGINLYQYAIDNPMSFFDVTGLVTVTKHVTKQPVYTLQDLDSRCRMTNGGVSGGGCTPTAFALGHCTCHCFGTHDYRPQVNIEITAVQIGFNGSWPLLRRTRVPHRSVHDYPTALAHEDNFHLDPSINKLVAEVGQRENSSSYPDQASCDEQGCTPLSQFVNREFSRLMNFSQYIEEHGGDPSQGLP